MKLNQIPDLDLQRTLKYICNLCGYPEVSSEKAPTVIKFLRDYHGHNTDAELISAFEAMAAGRLEEKVESFKSLTGLSASRVLQAYARQKRSNQTLKEMPDGKSEASEDTIRLIQQFSNRTIRFNQEISESEHRMLMDHWIGIQRENFKSNQRVDMLTSTTFDYLEKNGSLRIKNDVLQMWDGKSYIDLMPWEQVQDLGLRQKAAEDKSLNNFNRREFRTIGAPCLGDSLEKVTKRVAVSIYFEHVI